MVYRQQLFLTYPEPVSLRPIVFSHGWCALEPFSVNEEPFSFSYATVLDGLPVDINVSERGEGGLRVRFDSRKKISVSGRRRCRALVESMLRLHEPFDAFYRLTGRELGLRWIRRAKAGRMLRAGSFFEDLIKVVCTTNCSWALTTAMVRNLCRMLGTETPGGSMTFPSPESIAGQSESFIRKEIRAGYRAPYLLELSRAAAEGSLDGERFRSGDVPTDEVYRELTALKGIGPYAAESLLKLIGRYDHLALDSWTRKQYYELYHKGRKVTDRTIAGRYAKYGEWAGLVFWLEMTQHWYREKFPL
jgi:3-methyladenine DNA glycosylase/8-oxoguanine DNA glycosylase